MPLLKLMELMGFYSAPRLFGVAICKGRCFSTPSYSTASGADKFWVHLQKNGGQMEKNLASVEAQLNATSVSEVMHRCSAGQSLLGVRFFIWAGLQSSYRHSSYMYSKACQLLEIDRNPHLLTDVFETYRVQGCLVSVKTFKVVLNLCKAAKLPDEGLWVLRKMEEFNCCADTTAYNVVIRLFCERCDMDSAEGLMKEMGSIDLYPDMITYIAMIKGFCSVGRLEDACGLFKLMREHGCSPNAVAYSTLLDGVCRLGSGDRGLELLREMEQEGEECSPNVVTYTSVIQNFCKKGQLVEALGILDHMEARGCDINRVTASILIKGLCAEGRVEETYKLIDRMVIGGSVSNGECYSSLVVSLLKFKGLEEAEKLFRKMLSSQIKPDGLACSLVIKGLCLEGRVLDAFILYVEIEKMGYLSTIDSDVYSILLAGLCKESHLTEAAKLARLMLGRGVRLKAPYVDDAVQHLKNSGNEDIVLQLTEIRKLS